MELIPPPSSSNTTYILSGELKKQQSKNNKKYIILYLDIDSRVTCIQKNEVSSVTSDPKSVIRKLKHDNGNLLQFLAVISSQESDNKQLCLAHLSKLKVFKKNGRDMLQMTASANKFDSSGKFAKDSINLNNIPEGETTMTIFSEDDFISYWEKRLFVIKYQSAENFFNLYWRNLPGSSAQWNWSYLANRRPNDYPAVIDTRTNEFIFRGLDINGNLNNVAAFTRDNLPNNMSLFGINNFESWRQQYGSLFGL